MTFRSKVLARTSSSLEHRHQRCKAPSLCKTFFITSNCRLKETVQKNYLSHNVFLSTPFSHRFSHNVFLTTSYSQRLSHNIFLTLLPLNIGPHNDVLTKSQHSRNPSVLYKYPKISQICRSSDPSYINILC